MNRIFLPLLLALALSAFGCGDKPAQQADQEQPAKAETAEPIRLTYANFPPPITVPCVQMERFKEVLEERTGGRVQVETFPSGSLLKSKNMLRGVIEGQADIGCLSMSYQPGVFPTMTAVELPLGITSSKVASQVLFELYETLKPAEFDEVKVLTLFACPPSDVMSTAPVKSLADLQGFEIRASGTSGRFIELLGASPVAMPMPEVPDALQKNLVKGIFTSLEVMKDMKFAEFCPYMTTLNGPVYVFAVVMNKAKYDSLPDDVKQTLADLGPEQAAWTGEYWDQHVLDAIEWSKAEKGAELYTLTAEEQAAVAARTESLTDAWKASASAAGVDAEAVLAKVRELKAKYE
ncbi:MAG: TRAP transporter substrate-binding protein [Desulfovibrionaceae bacterium]